MPKTVAILALLFTAGCRAATAMKQVELVERVFLAQQGWTVAQKPSTLQPITLQIGLSLQNTDVAIGTLLDLSNRKSKNYGKWLDRDEVNGIVQPSKQANDAVINWLKTEGVSKVTSDGTWITFVTTLGTANRILNADFQRYSRNGVSKTRTTAYSVPEDLANYIDIIHPTTFFGKTATFDPVYVNFEEPAKDSQAQSQLETRQSADTPSIVQQKVPDACARFITPACIKQLYNVGNYTPSANSGSRIGFGSFLNESAQFSDLKSYLDYYRLPSHNWTKVPINQGAIPKSPSFGEANLDVQNIVGVAYPLPVVEFLTAGSPPFIPDLEMTNSSQNTNEPYVPYYRYLLLKKNSELPQVISNSYGEPEQTVPRRYAARTCQMIALMGLRGVTILESSGDTGVGSSCRRNDGSNDARFDAQFPSTCPWITSIGGTESVNPEIAWRDSSGGFSEYFSRPSYQADAIETYLEEKVLPATLQAYSRYFNPRGRAFPDISAHSLLPNYAIFNGGRRSASGGTSAAAPVVAGLVGLLNDARFKAKLPSVGFLNPWLYDSGNDFLIDITLGASRGCDGTNHQNGRRVKGGAVIPGSFWNATTGWDPATGLGIPDFQKMMKTSLAQDGDDAED